MAYDYELVSVKKEGRLAVATVSNPPINLITPQLYMELAGLSKELAADPDVLVVGPDVDRHGVAVVGADLGRGALGDVLAVLRIGQALDRRHRLALVQAHDAHALGGAPHRRDGLDRDADQAPGGGDEDEVVLVLDQAQAGDRAVARAGLDRDDAHAAQPLQFGTPHVDRGGELVEA